MLTTNSVSNVNIYFYLFLFISTFFSDPFFYHLGQEPGCGLKLTLKTANNILDKVFCAKHTPKDKPTATTVDGNMALANAKSKY